jgi:predicted  nucleic acid-binding Zn-ribbon protein
MLISILSFLQVYPVDARSIPDEINYSYYDQILEQLDDRKQVLESERGEVYNDLRFARARLNEIGEDLRREEVELDQIYARERGLLRDQDILKEKIERNSREIRSLSEELNSRERTQVSLVRELEQVKREERSYEPLLQRQVAKVAAIKTDYARLSSDVSKIESTLGNLQTELRSVNQLITSLDSQITSASRELDQSESQLRQYKSQQQSLASDLRELNQKISSIKSKLARLGSDIQTSTRKVLALKDDVETLQRSISKNESLLLTLRQELSRLQRMSRRNYPKEKEVKRKIEKMVQAIKLEKLSLSQKNRALSDEKNILNGLETEKAKKEQSLAKKQSKYDELYKLGQRLPKIITDLKRKISLLESTIINKTREKTRQLALKSSKQREISSVNRALVDKKRALEAKYVLLSREEKELAEMNRAFQSILTALRQLEKRVQENVARINFITKRRVELDQIVDSDRRRIRSLETELERNARLMGQIQRRITQLQDEANYQAREVRTIETVLVSKDREIELVIREIEIASSERQSRYSLYQEYLTQALELGTNAARERAQYAGQAQGVNDAQVSGQRNGLFFGQKIGLLTGYIDGLKEGAEKGKREGLRDGRADDSSYQEGYSVGFKLGLANAHRQANDVVYPQSYRDYRDELQEKIENVLSHAAGFDKIESSNSSLARELQSIEELIREKESILEKMNQPSYRLSKSEFAFSVPSVDIPSVGSSCRGVYKGYIDFLRACEESFSRSYLNQFLSSYERTFKSDYEGFYGPEFDSAFDNNKNVEVIKGKTEGHQIAYKEYFAKGAGEVYQEGHEEGIEIGYDENIAELSRLAKTKALKDARNFYQSHPLAWIGKADNITLSSDAPRNELRSGATVKLALNVTNSGGVQLKSASAKVRIKNLSNNLMANSDWFDIQEIEAGGSINISNILSFKIKDNAKAGEVISFSIEMRSPGDEVDDYIVETINVSKRLKVNPEVRVSLDFNNKTRWRKWKFWPFKWEYRKETIAVNLTGINENVPGSYTVALEQLNGPRVVQVSENTRISSPSVGRMSSGSISYRFTKKARKEKVNFKLSIWYEGELIKQRDLSIFIK